VHLSAVLLLEIRQEVANNWPAGWSIELRHRPCLYGVRRRIAPSAIPCVWTLVDVVVEGCRRRRRCPGVSRGGRRMPRKTVSVRPVTSLSHGRRSRPRQRRDWSPPSQCRLHRRVESAQSSEDSSRLYKRRQDGPGRAVPALIVWDERPSVRYARVWARPRGAARVSRCDGRVAKARRRRNGFRRQTGVAVYQCSGEVDVTNRVTQKSEHSTLD